MACWMCASGRPEDCQHIGLCPDFCCRREPAHIDEDRDEE